MQNYVIEHRIGSGASGVTYKVRNKITGEIFAMKCVRRGDRIDESVKREILNHRGLQHPNIIQFKEVVLDDKKLGIVMEYADGGDLSDQVLFEGKLTEAKARKMSRKLIEGVSYIHSKEICHRDLKLENILLTSNDDLKIGGFDLSKASLHLSRTESTAKTSIYMAPEVSSHGEYDGKLADVWSSGVSLYVMLTGEYPSENIVSQCVKVADVSDQCRELLSRMLVVDPTKRITIEEIRNHPWYSMNLPDDLKEEAQTVYRQSQNVTYPRQSEEEIVNIIEKARSIIPSSMESVAEA